MQWTRSPHRRRAATRVLLVDDDLWLQSVLAELLTDEGYSVVRARTGQEGLTLAEREAPAVILLDLSLPGLLGVELLKALKERPTTRAIPVFVVSAYTELLEECRGCDAQGLFQKPVDLTELLDGIRQVVGGPTGTQTAA